MKIILRFISSIFIFGAIIFFIQMVYPAPHWKDVCTGACNKMQQGIIASKDISYRNNIHQIFTVLSFLFAGSAILFIILSKKKYISTLLISISVLTGIYGFYTFPQKLLFSYGQSLPIYYSFFISIVLASVGLYINNKAHLIK